MDTGLQGRVALVTGASRGIGRGIAAALAAEGVRVAVSSRSRERIEAAAREVSATPFVHDSADLDGVPELVRLVTEALGPIDVLVANTGGPPAGPDPLAFPREDWEAAHRNLVLFPMTLIEHVVPGMAERGWGRVVSVASSAVREPLDRLVLSNAHRTGTLAAFKTLSRRFAARGVTFNSLLTGRIATERLADLYGSMEAAGDGVPAGRPGTVEEMAAAAVFLCSDGAGYITGAALPVDGGLLRSL